METECWNKNKTINGENLNWWLCAFDKMEFWLLMELNMWMLKNLEMEMEMWFLKIKI